MHSRLGKLDFKQFERMKRARLIETILDLREVLPLKVSQTWLMRQSTDHLRLFLLAAKLYSAVRSHRLESRLRTGGSPGANARSNFRAFLERN